MTARHDFMTKLGRAWDIHVYRSDHAHEAALINIKGGGGGGGEAYSAEVGQNPLAECVPPDRIR